MPDGNGLDFDLSLPGDQSSVRFGAQEIRNLRSALKTWSGNNPNNNTSVFEAGTAQATIRDSVITSSMLQAPAQTVAAVGNPSPDMSPNADTYSAVSLNAKGQVVRGKKATLDELAAISTSTLAAANITPSATARQFLRTNSAASGTEWVTSAVVARWDTSQAITFLEVPNIVQSTQRDTGVSSWNGVVWDGTSYVLCGTTGIKYSKELFSFRSATVAASSILRQVRYVKNTVGTNVSGVVVGSSGGNGILYTETATFDLSPSSRSRNGGSWVDLYSAASDGTQWVFVGASGTIYYFATLPGTGTLNPTIVTSNTTQTLNDVAYGNGIYVAVGNSGVVCKFSGGSASATAVSPGGSAALKGVAYVQHIDKWVVVGDGGVVHVSTDNNATAWTSTTLNAAVNFNSVAAGNGVILVVGDTGNIWRSVDGVVWTNVSANVYRASATPAVSQISANLNRVQFCAGSFVAVGPSVVLLAGDLPIPTWKTAGNAPDEDDAPSGTTYWRHNVSYALPHNFAQSPAHVSAYLVCVDPITTLGYVVGDLVPVEVGTMSGSTNDELERLRVMFNSSHLVVRFPKPGSTATATSNPRFSVFDRTYKGTLSGDNAQVTEGGVMFVGNSATSIDPSCWRLRLVATSVI